MAIMLDHFKSLTKGIQDKAVGSLFAQRAAERDRESAEVEPGAFSSAFCAEGKKKPWVTVCTPNEKCRCESAALRQALVEEIGRFGLDIQVGAAKTGCDGECHSGPFIGFPAKRFFYLQVTPDSAREVVVETLIKGKVLFPLLSINPDRSYRSDILFERDTGMLAAIDQGVCMVEVAKYFLDWEKGLSCGKCVPCRLGMQRMYESMERIVGGTGTMEDLEHIKTLCHTMINTAHCLFAATSSRPVLSAITYFEDEFKDHIERQECSTGVCGALVEIQKKRAARARLRKGKKKKKK